MGGNVSIPFVTRSQQLSGFESRHLAKSDKRQSQKSDQHTHVRNLPQKIFSVGLLTLKPFYRLSLLETGCFQYQRIAHTQKLLLTCFRRKKRWNQQQFKTQQGPEDKPTQLTKEFNTPIRSYQAMSYLSGSSRQSSSI
jgi:hypothetical protein